MSTIGQIERKTQQRIVQLFQNNRATPISATGRIA